MTLKPPGVTERLQVMELIEVLEVSEGPAGKVLDDNEDMTPPFCDL